MGALVAVGCNGGSEIEVIHAVPEFVLTVGEVSQRVQRAPYELGTELSNVRIVGVVVRAPEPCNPERGPWACPKGADALYWFADGAPSTEGGWLEPGGPVIAVEILGGADDVQPGRRYVLWGSAEMAPAVPQRWVFRAKVLAEVR
jgi:hypothetical protein